VLSQDCTIRRWTGDNPDDMFHADRDDARWLPQVRGFNVRVLDVVHHDARPAWSFDGHDFPADPPRTSVRYVVTRTGDWSGSDDDDHDRLGYMDAGEGECYDLTEWRDLAQRLQVVAGR
jgi:hypothetical protein